ncbi:MAG: threonine--tRNA ligase [Deltaproteobacteria bacterium]|nr:threonine--tRNA ligase [Deltaproteobacteria bacterium]
MEGKISVTVAGRPVQVAHGASAGQLLKGFGNGRLVAARVNGKPVDLSCPVGEGATVEPVLADSPEGLEILRHSTAHLMAQAVQQLFPGVQVTIGPAIEEGFYYDFAAPRPFALDDLPRIEARMRELAGLDLKIERLEMSREEAAARFAALGERYKVEILSQLQEPRVSVYRQGDWMDLCRGPHVPSTGHLQAFKLLSVAGAYWRGDERNPMLSRIYGTSFASERELAEHLRLLELARQRDHRKLGRELELFFFDPVSPGSAFFLPRGTVIYRELESYIRRLYRRYGFAEVITPELFRNELWQRSGHWEMFRENMFLTSDGERGAGAPDYGLKPMNCPGHALIYRLEKRSYRDLPLRLADFGRLHRAERAGVLHGLTRVRAMAQDDAHIFCLEGQVGAEIDRNLQMVKEVYQALGFGPPKARLATMPDKHLGSEELWRQSEAVLAQALERNGFGYVVNRGEGAFYGPKIELYVPDALGRNWQLATIQLDYNLPQRFDLSYIDASGLPARPVMIHRAILGSIERFIGVLLEHTGGVLPFWLAPEQVRVLSLSEKVEPYAAEVAELLERRGARVARDLRNEKLGLKVRQAELAKVPYIVVVGEREAAQRGVSLRRLRGAKQESLSLEQLAALIGQEAPPG